MARMRPDNRKAELAKIHIAKKELQMDDEQYRAVLWTVARVDSARDLDAAGRAAVLKHLRSRGFKSRPRRRVAEHPGTPHNIGREAQLTKIEAQLADMKLPWSYADRIAQQMFGIERVAWARKPAQFRAIIAALGVEQSKRAALQQVDALLAELGLDHSYVDRMVRPGLRGRWQRNQHALGVIGEHLTLRKVTADERRHQRERAARRF